MRTIFKQNKDIIFDTNEVRIPLENEHELRLRYADDFNPAENTLIALFNEFIEYAIFDEHGKNINNKFAVSFNYNESSFYIIERKNDEPVVFKECNDGYCFLPYYKPCHDCGDCPNNINDDGWGGNQPCGQQICEYSCEYCCYNNCRSYNKQL